MERKKLISLATRAIAGDKEAFEQLYVSHARSILFHVRSQIIDKENYNDVAQDVAIRMYKNVAQLREPAAFRGWMHQVIRTTCLNHNRSVIAGEKHESSFEDEEIFETIEDEGWESDPEAVALAKLEGNQLFAIVSELPVKHREIIVQRYYDDLSYKEIAEAQGISVTNVSTRLQRAMTAIREVLGQTGVGDGILDKGIAMKQNAVRTSEEEPSEQELKDRGLDDNIGLAPALYSGITMLIPDAAVTTFTVSTGVKLTAITAATAATGSTALTASVGKAVPAVLAYTLATISVVFALVVGGTAVTSVLEPEESTASSVVVQHEYPTEVNIIFTDAKGGTTDLNVVSVSLVEDEPSSVKSNWELFVLGELSDTATEEGKTADNSPGLLESGSGTEIDSSILSTLPPGNYHVVFMLEASNGATAQVSRSFTIA